MIVYPRDFPACAGIENVSFSTQFQQARSVTGGGTPNVAELGPPMWRGEWSVRTIGREQYAEWSAWLRSLRGGLGTFKGSPFLWKWPLSYPRGFAGLLVAGVQWDGFGSIAAIAPTRDAITIDQVPAGFTLRAGDWLSFAIGSRQVLHQVTVGAVADGGGALTVGVEPTIRPNAVLETPVRFETPYCEMSIPGDVDLSLSVVKEGRFSFSGLQVLI